MRLWFWGTLLYSFFYFHGFEFLWKIESLNAVVKFRKLHFVYSAQTVSSHSAIVNWIITGKLTKNNPACVQIWYLLSFSPFVSTTLENSYYSYVFNSLLISAA